MTWYLLDDLKSIKISAGLLWDLYVDFGVIHTHDLLYVLLELFSQMVLQERD